MTHPANESTHFQDPTLLKRIFLSIRTEISEAHTSSFEVLQPDDGPPSFKMGGDPKSGPISLAFGQVLMTSTSQLQPPDVVLPGARSDRAGC